MKKRKQTMVLLSLVAFLLILVIAYFAMTKVIKNKVEEEREEDIIELYSLDTSTATKLKITNEYGTISLVKKNDNWYLKSDKKFPLDESIVSTMLATLKTIKASRSVIDDASDLGEYGLDNPKIIISIELEGGVSAKVELGNTVPIQNGYYGKIDEENHVYVMDESYYTNFSYKLNELMVIKDAPSIDADTVTYLKTDNAKEASFEATLNEDGVWKVIGPYKEAVRGDDAKLKELFQNYSSITFGTCVEYNCKNPLKYGIGEDSARIDIKYYDAINKEKMPREYHLVIGLNDDNGNYYVQPEGTNYIYKMDETEVEDLLYVDAYEYIYSYMVSDTVDMIHKLSIDTKNATTKLSIKETTKTDKDGKDTIEYTCKRNNDKMDYDAFAKAYNALRKITYKGEIEEAKIKGEDVYATVTLESDSGEKKIQFLQYDDTNYYRVSVDGESYFLVEIKEIQSMINQFTK